MHANALNLRSLAVRPFCESDFAELTELWHRTNQAAYSYVSLHQQHTLSAAREFFRSAVLPQNQVWVAWLDNKPVGLLAFDGTRINQLAVKVEFQHSGV